jgi:transposase-like protein
MKTNTSKKILEIRLKISALKLIRELKESLSMLAEDVSISEKTLLIWKRKYITDQVNCFPGKSIQKPEDATLKQLRKEIVKLTDQLNFLKKT